MAQDEKVDFIHKDLKETFGSNESGKVHLAVDVKTGEAELVIQKTISERYPVQDYEKVMNLYDRLTCGRGRRVFKLEDLAHND